MLSLSPEDLNIIKDILKQYLSGLPVWAFGSRVTGKARKYSDLDLAVITEKPLDFGCMGEVREAFSESNLPFRVDILDWSRTDKNFKERIQENFVIIQ